MKNFNLFIMYLGLAIIVLSALLMVITKGAIFSPHFSFLFFLFVLFLGSGMIYFTTRNLRKFEAAQYSKKLKTSFHAQDFITEIHENCEYSMTDIESIRKLSNRLETIGFVFFVIGFVTSWLIILPLIFIPLGLICYFKAQKMKAEVKNWIYVNQLKTTEIQNVRLIPKIDHGKLYSVNFLFQLFWGNTSSTTLKIDDVVAFEYKKKYVELIDFTIKSGDDNIAHYLCLKTKNPDKTEGQTVSWSKKGWHFKFPHKVTTESVVFDKIFKTVSTNQVDARIHLKTNVMQDMIDLYERLTSKNAVFYFDESLIYIIFEAGKNALEPDLSKSITDQTTIKPILDDIGIGLKIFDDFWLSRKAYLKTL
jgi:hypothetical protein